MTSFYVEFIGDTDTQSPHEVDLMSVGNWDLPNLPGALCKGMADVDEVFFPKSRKSDVTEAKQICGLCPVQENCLKWVTDLEAAIGEVQKGVWGGTTEWERKLDPERPRMCRAGLHRIEGRGRCMDCYRMTSTREYKRRSAPGKVG